MIESKHSKNFAVLTINGKEYDIYIARTEKQKMRGLQGFEELPEDEGMLFVYDEEQPVSFWMKDTEIPLDIVFMDEDMKVISVKQGEPEDETPITESGVKYVLEVNQNSGIKEGDEADFDTEEDKYVMEMLAPDGSVQFELQGGERIFSRKSTKVLLRKALKAEREKEDRYYKSLGKYIFKELKAQDDRKPEYVEAPTKKEEE